MQITRMFVPKYKYDIKCPYEMQPEFIIVHNTENDASAMAEISYMIGNNKKVSFHCMSWRVPNISRRISRGRTLRECKASTQKSVITCGPQR